MNVSVIIPTKNRKQYLYRAVQSVLPQLRGGDEIIIVDDGSEDSEYLELDSNRVQVIRNKESKGGAVARNIGAKIAKNEVLMFLDDDDAWESKKIETQLPFLECDSVSLVFSGKKVVWDDALETPFREIKVKKSSFNLADLTECNYIGSTSSVAVKKQHFIDAGGFDSNLACFQDYDLWLRLLVKGEAIYDGQTNVIYTVFKEKGMQISRANDGRHELATVYLLNKYFSTFSEGNYINFKSNLYQLVSKAMNHSNPRGALFYSLKALKINFSIRGVKFLVAAIAANLGYKHG